MYFYLQQFGLSGLEVYSHKGPNWDHQVKKEKERHFAEILQLHAFSIFFVMSTEVQAWLLFSALKLHKLAEFVRAEPKPFKIEMYLYN